MKEKTIVETVTKNNELAQAMVDGFKKVDRPPESKPKQRKIYDYLNSLDDRNLKCGLAVMAIAKESSGVVNTALIWEELRFNQLLFDGFDFDKCIQGLQDEVVFNDE